MSASIAILGAGVMGTAMAVPACAAGARVALVGTHLDEDIVACARADRTHPRLRIALPHGVTAYRWTELGGALGEDLDLLVVGVSSAGVGWALDRLAETLRRPVPILMLTKGMAVAGDDLETLPAFLARELRRRTGVAAPVMAVGGPCIAAELAARRDTGVVFVGEDAAAVADAIRLLEAPFYHARPSADVAGVEVCAAFKNFFAIGVGWANGRLERDGVAENGAFAHNLAASLFAQALGELGILAEALGGERASVSGLPGAGDLYVTCQAGRNARLGRLLGLGKTYRSAKAEDMPDDTVEGADLALAVGPALEAMWRDGRLPAARMPLARALVGAIREDRALEIDWRGFHR